MRKYAYDYTICRNNSPQVFIEACAQIETLFPNLEKKKLLIDVDGSTIQVYEKAEKKVVVYDDYDVGAVYALSDINLGEWFENAV